MWQLENIKASNLCAFKDLNYDVLQGHTTLIFGNNMDNDSQGSNGSGKSAMLEAIAIGITGEPLRKIRMEEIINDAEDNAQIGLTFSNSFTGQKMTIERQLFRKAPQNIKITIDDKPEVQATVVDYNRFILDTLGLTKDDIYTNFILSKHKYTSFLSSSDKDKKELINRFSNGVMVDESIAALQADMLPIQDKLKEAESTVANYSGRVSALEEQIVSAVNESTERSQKKAERKQSWEDAIVEKRAYIREQNNTANHANDILTNYDKLDEALQKLENGDQSIKVIFKNITERFEEFQLQLPTDYVTVSETFATQLKDIAKEYAAVSKQADKDQAKAESVRKAHNKLQERYEQFKETYDKKAEKINNKINTLLKSIKDLEDENVGLKNQRTKLERNIADLQHVLAGVIVCPKCNHEFVLGGEVDITETKAKLADSEGEIQDIANTIEQNQKNIADFTEQGRGVRADQNTLIASKSEWSTKITDSLTELNNCEVAISSNNKELQRLADRMDDLKAAVSGSRRKLFDEAYEILDDSTQHYENVLKQCEININNANGAIKSYEESIADLDKSSETDMIESLKASKAKYEKELATAISDKESVERELNAYKAQEATFVEFKTHLANSKIDALSQITNEFLEAIGSDIRISFSGYTVLKSGKIRDKISISLIRDGIDCGSFDKFSEGEKARVNLANILAMHKLTNVNCDDGKGLDLLVLDEILEATDEQGLSNIFDALNQLQITSLVVSHGNIAESYPYKTVVNKLNGISYIND